MKKSLRNRPILNLDTLINFLCNIPAATAVMLLSIPAFAQDAGDSIADRDKLSVNSAGTVRVNNLANIEALLNIISNALEILLLAVGIWLFIRAFRQVNPFSVSPTESSSAQTGVAWGLCLWGLALIALGLAIPGTINWFCASARDMSYFS